MSQSICERLWIVKELKMKIELPLQLYSDSQTTISITHNTIQHDKTKHIENWEWPIFHKGEVRRWKIQSLFLYFTLDNFIMYIYFPLFFIKEKIVVINWFLLLYNNILPIVFNSN